MKKFITHSLLASSLLLMTAVLQAQNKIAQEVSSRISGQETFTTEEDLFKIASTTRNATARAEVPNATILELQPAALKKILASNARNLALTIPTLQGNKELQLYEVNLFSEGFTVSTSDGHTFTGDNGKHYRGIINNNDQSLVAISIYEDEIMGLIVDGNGNNVLGKTKQGAEYIFYNDRDMPNSNPAECHTTADFVKNPATPGNEKIAATTRCVRAYWEADYDLYTNKGSSTANVVSYLTGLFNQSKLIYDNDGISVMLQEIFVWTSASPYSGNSSNKLGQFRTYRTSFNGDLAHLMHLAGGGGIAYVNTLCATGWNYGVSGIYDTYSNYPTYSWSVMVVTHEQGHIMGSQHTHDCVWNGNNTAIDACASTSCTSTEGSAPAGGGTIMSYCHLTSTGINLSKGFGPQPKERIQTTINSKSCLGTGCDTTYVTLVNNAIYNMIVAHSGKLADVSSASTANGGNVLQWEANGGTNQQWRAVSLGNDYWRFENVNSGKVLSVKDSSVSNSANLHQWTWANTNNQQWSLRRAGGGYFYIVNRNSGKGIDVYQSSTANGANIHQYDLWYGNNQRWRFDLVVSAVPEVASSPEATTEQSLVLAPNPAYTELYVTVFSESEKQATLAIHDMRGLIVHTEKTSLIKGRNTLRTDAVAGLAPGLYVVETAGKKAKLIIEK